MESTATQSQRRTDRNVKNVKTLSKGKKRVSEKERPHPEKLRWVLNWLFTHTLSCITVRRATTCDTPQVKCVCGQCVFWNNLQLEPEMWASSFSGSTYNVRNVKNGRACTPFTHNQQSQRHVRLQELKWNKLIIYKCKTSGILLIILGINRVIRLEIYFTNWDFFYIALTLLKSTHNIPV